MLLYSFYYEFLANLGVRQNKRQTLLKWQTSKPTTCTQALSLHTTQAHGHLCMRICAYVRIHFCKHLHLHCIAPVNTMHAGMCTCTYGYVDMYVRVSVSTCT